ncbi:MAG: TadE/TadG family type IV pilus assembly protein, partial [Vulcanimicrobiaceae bacterium]
MTILKRADRGTALAEMALIAPLLLILLLGLIEAGKVGDYAIRVTSAARAGVQFGAQNEATAGDTQGMQNAASADAQYAGITAIAA